MWNQEPSGAAVETLVQSVRVVSACFFDNGEADVAPSSAGASGLGGRLTRDALLWRSHRMTGLAEKC